MEPKRYKTRILLVDHDPVVTCGLSRLINCEPDLCVYATTHNIGQALSAIVSSEVNAVILTLSLEHGHGFELIKHVRAVCDKLPILVFSTHDESLFAERALKAGALGYVMIQEPRENILTAIRSVLSGNVHLSQQMKNRFLNRYWKNPADDQPSRVGEFTDREFEVFNLIGCGKTVREIAALFRITPKTVETHRSRIMRKLKSRGALHAGASARRDHGLERRRLRRLLPLQTAAEAGRVGGWVPRSGGPHQEPVRAAAKQTAVGKWRQEV